MTTNAEKIQMWRDANPSKIITEPVLLDILGLNSLSGVDLSGADLYGAHLSCANLYGTNLYGANLAGADLSGTNLRGANLRWASLYGADLRGANLCRADLYSADLYGANLAGADLSGFAFQGLPSGDGCFLATSESWRITIGCWGNRTLDDLRDLIADRTEWPEAEGDERESRRPILQGLLAMCEAYAAKYPNAVEELQEIYGDQS